MNRTFKVLALAAMLLAVCLVGVVIAQTLKTERQPAFLTDEKALLIEKIQSSADHPLRIREDADAPLKILSVGVKEISREDYQKLTGKITELNSVFSVPEAALQNTSGKKITEVFFITRDLSTNKLKGMMMKDVSIEPGQTFHIKRGGAVKIDSITEAESMSNENYWLPFANIDRLLVSVAVTFSDGTEWANRESNN